MAISLSAFSATNGTARNSYTLNALKRWSCGDKDLPDIKTIKEIHIYDFDNTLFRTPTPNKQIWKSDQVGFLHTQDAFVNGGWWHDPAILTETGEGIDVEEPRAWAGCWNEDVVDLMEQSLATPSALTVLLTGRAETIFADLIKRMLHSRHLEADMVSLKPEVSPTNERFGSTMKFKQAFLETVINTYHAASELRIYEDREKHVEQFRLYLESFNEAVANGTSSRGARTTPLQQFHVIEVPEQVSNLDPVREVALIQRLVNTHNAAYAAQVANAASVSKRLRPYALRRTVLFTGYLISPADSLRLLAAADKKPGSNMYRTLANTVMITTRQDPQVALDKAGGIGHRVTWRATATGNYDNKIWAAKVEPLHGASVHTETNPPAVVLALREGGKPFDVGRISKWTDLKGEPVEFETTVGEKVLLRIEAEEPLNGKASAGATQNTPRGYASHSGYGKPDRKRPYDEDFPTLGAPSGPRQQQNQQGNPRGPTHAPRGPARGGGGNHNNQNQKGRGGGRGGGGGQRGRGGGGKRGKGFVGYQSLDDMGGGGGKGRGGASEGEMAY